MPNPVWAVNPANVSRTLDIIRFIATNLGETVDVIELLNEPAGYINGFVDVIRQYWSDGYQVVRNAAGGGVKVMIENAFLSFTVGGILPISLNIIHSHRGTLDLVKLVDLSRLSGGHHGLCELTFCVFVAISSSLLNDHSTNTRFSAMPNYHALWMSTSQYVSLSMLHYLHAYSTTVCVYHIININLLCILQSVHRTR